MRVFDMIVDERLHAADLLSGLTAEQLRRPSLCQAWTVHEIGAHLVTYLRFGKAKLYWGIASTLGDLDRANLRLTAREAARPIHEIIERLRRGAGSRMAIPRTGYDPVLADSVLHDLDVRVPLGIPRTMPEERLWVAFHHLTVRPAPGYAMGSRLDGLRLEATDTGWRHGVGAPVRGDAESLLLAVAGRAPALDRLDGDGVPILRQRLAARSTAGPIRRMAAVVAVVTHPAPPQRRSHEAVAP